MSDDKKIQSPVSAATQSVVGGTKGGIVGGVVGGALFAGIAAAAGAVLGAVASYFTGSTLEIDGQEVPVPTLDFMGAGATLGAVAGGATGLAAGAAVGSISGAVAGHNNTAIDQGPSKEQVAQVAYAQGVVQGATMAKVEQLEHTQEDHSTKWRDTVGQKKAHDSHVSMVNDQASKAALAAMDPQGRA